jgi:hypothetical protein
MLTAPASRHAWQIPFHRFWPRIYICIRAFVFEYKSIVGSEIFMYVYVYMLVHSCSSIKVLLGRKFIYIYIFVHPCSSIKVLFSRKFVYMYIYRYIYVRALVFDYKSVIELYIQIYSCLRIRL